MLIPTLQQYYDIGYVTVSRRGVERGEERGEEGEKRERGEERRGGNEEERRGGEKRGEESDGVSIKDDCMAAMRPAALLRFSCLVPLHALFYSPFLPSLSFLLHVPGILCGMTRPRLRTLCEPVQPCPAAARMACFFFIYLLEIPLPFRRTLPAVQGSCVFVSVSQCQSVL